ncbi:MAG: serine/threonine-protein kinase, partial [Gammaproteobacteria bacterium]
VARPEHLEDSEHGPLYKQLFFNEAQTAGLLKHPNITAIYDAGVDRGYYYIVMEYVHGGGTLERHTKADTLLPIESVTSLLYQCAMALAYAHKRGVVHRDIKPRNILLTPDGEAKISDFGVAVTPEAARASTPEHAGSPLYMAPEQIRREPASAQSDLFSLGVVAYELLTGRHPFHGENLDAIEHRILNSTPPRLAGLNADIPEIYQRIMDKVLAKSRSRRYRSCQDMAGDITLVYDFLSLPAVRLSREEKYRQVEKLAFFADFPDSERWELINAAEWLRLEAGTEVVREGERDTAFFIVVSGHAQVLKHERDLVTLEPGDCFGEMGMLSGRRRSATIRALGDFAAMKLRASTLERMSVNAQLRFQRGFLTALIERLETTTERLAVPVEER